MVISRIAHAQITIPKGQERSAREFYCDFLGLSEVEKPDSLAGRGGLWLSVGDLQVHVGAEDGVNRWATKAHIAYEVDDLDAWETCLTEKQVQIERQPPIPNYRRFLFRDPFGNRVEFLEKIVE